MWNKTQIEGSISINTQHSHFGQPLNVTWGSESHCFKTILKPVSNMLILQGRPLSLQGDCFGLLPMFKTGGILKQVATLLPTTRSRIGHAATNPGAWDST